jgi:LacI family transcriptional regulator
VPEQSIAAPHATDSGEPSGRGGSSEPTVLVGSAGSAESAESADSADPSRAPRRARPTMRDVAERAGVGIKTVSRVVNGEPGVNPATAERVSSAIADLGFRRNDSARLLRQGHTASIGLVIEDVADPFSSVLTREVEEVARRHGSLVFTGSSAEDPMRERELTLALCARRVDGIVVVPAAADHSFLNQEIEAGLAVVFVDRPAKLADADVVITDNVSGTRAGVAHLIAHGHRRIGFLGDASSIFTAQQRLAGYRDAMAAAGLPIDEAWIAMGPPRPDHLRATLDALLGPDASHPVTALFTGNNRTTVGVLREFAARGVAVTDRPALVGFDDFELADMLTPGVTVVAQDPAEMGRTAAGLLFARLDGDLTPYRTIELPTVLIPRGSGEQPPTAH